MRKWSDEWNRLDGKALTNEQVELYKKNRQVVQQVGTGKLFIWVRRRGWLEYKMNSMGYKPGYKKPKNTP